MKKYFILISFVFIFIFRFNVNAEDSWWLHESENVIQLSVDTHIEQMYSNYYGQIIEIDNINIDQNTEGIYVSIPASTSLLLSYGGINAGVTFKDSNGNIIDTGKSLIDYKIEGDITKPDGVYYINTISIGTNLENYIVDNIRILIMTSFSTIPASNWGIFMHDKTLVQKVVNGDVDYNNLWQLENLMDNYKYIYTDYIITKNWRVTQLFIPQSSYHVNKYDKLSYISKVEYYDNTDTVICNYDLSAEINFNKIININPSDNSCNIYVNSIKRARIKILQKPFDLNFNSINYINFLNDNSIIAFNTELFLVNVYNGAILIKQNAYVRNNLTGTNLPYFDLDYLPEPINKGLVFNNFAYSSGTEYNMKYQKVGEKYYFYGLFVPDGAYFSNNTINLYANFGLKAVDSTINKNIDVKLENVIGAFGFNTVSGYLLLYFSILLIVDIGLYMYFRSNFIILIVDLVLTGFFTYLGVFTMLILILLYALITSMFILEVRRE